MSLFKYNMTAINITKIISSSETSWLSKLYIIQVSNVYDWFTSNTIAQFVQQRLHKCFYFPVFDAICIALIQSILSSAVAAWRK